MSDGRQGRRARRAYVCYDTVGKEKVVHERKFLGPNDPVPTCAAHGKMEPQPNARYRGKRV